VSRVEIAGEIRFCAHVVCAFWKAARAPAQPTSRRNWL
jgi:hypothetical protein